MITLYLPAFHCLVFSYHHLFYQPFIKKDELPFSDFLSFPDSYPGENVDVYLSLAKKVQSSYRSSDVWSDSSLNLGFFNSQKDNSISHQNVITAFFVFPSIFSETLKKVLNFCLGSSFQEVFKNEVESFDIKHKDQAFKIFRNRE